MSIGSPLVKMVHFYGHSSKANNAQHEQLQQLKESNAFFQTRVADTHDDITNVASATASAVAQAIVTNPQASIPV